MTAKCVRSNLRIELGRWWAEEDFFDTCVPIGVDQLCAFYFHWMSISFVNVWQRHNGTSHVWHSNERERKSKIPSTLLIHAWHCSASSLPPFVLLWIIVHRQTESETNKGERSSAHLTVALKTELMHTMSCSFSFSVNEESNYERHIFIKISHQLWSSIKGIVVGFGSTQRPEWWCCALECRDGVPSLHRVECCSDEEAVRGWVWW